MKTLGTNGLRITAIRKKIICSSFESEVIACVEKIKVLTGLIEQLPTPCLQRE